MRTAHAAQELLEQTGMETCPCVLQAQFCQPLPQGWTLSTAHSMRYPCSYFIEPPIPVAVNFDGTAQRECCESASLCCFPFPRHVSRVNFCLPLPRVLSLFARFSTNTARCSLRIIKGDLNTRIYLLGFCLGGSISTLHHFNANLNLLMDVFISRPRDDFPLL
jgi:hypothetical protein